MGVGKSYGNDEMSYANIELWSDESGDVELFEGNFGLTRKTLCLPKDH